jgi:hypothetical protein
MKKRPPQLRKHGAQVKGQLTIFLGITLLVVMSLLAFIVNVGLFVKAKINLQNAVDAAAWSGAAVQARQLSTLAYLNWELRNVYKEWMFKYYVLGQFSLSKTRLTGAYDFQGGAQPGGGMSFLMESFWKGGGFPGASNPSDPFNLPSICMHYGIDVSAKNICEIYNVPGIPRFNTVGIPGVSELHEALVNSITKTKMNDCSRRSNYNFATAMIYAYGNRQLTSDDSLVATERPGAWPAAFELGVRARNVEAYLNRPPITEARGGICFFDGSCLTPDTLNRESTPLNERPISSFWSAFRNLNPELQRTFKMYELSPKPYRPQGLSAMLIPEYAQIDNQRLLDAKYYVDIQMYPLNLVTFFTSFVSKKDPTGYGAVASEAECSATRVGIPVPAYIFGFIKNPEVLTYYAVKGEARFTGIFFPFASDREGILLKAYAAAKPYGGRIGPRLFAIDGQRILPRQDNRQHRSLPYLSGLRLGASGGFIPGYPIPTTQGFWVQDKSSAVGGVPDNSGQGVSFAVPNLLYDFPNTVNDLGMEQTLKQVFNIVGPGGSVASQSGLYDKQQFRLFASNMAPAGGGAVVISGMKIMEGIFNVRRPTKYEALNYLIPTCQRADDAAFDTPPNTVQTCNDSMPVPQSYFAPFYGDNALYKNRNDVVGAVNKFILANRSAIETYRNAMQGVAQSIMDSGHIDPTAVIPAAQGFYNMGPISSAQASYPGSPGETSSIAGKFWHFFTGSGTVTGTVALGTAMQSLWAQKETEDPRYKDYYVAPYLPARNSVTKRPVPRALISSAYMPGPRQGADEQGQYLTTTDNKTFLGRRNFYSTKFIQIQSLLAGNPENYTKNAAYMESAEVGNIPSDMLGVLAGPNLLKNALSPADLQEFAQSPKDLDH